MKFLYSVIGKKHDEKQNSIPVEKKEKQKWHSEMGVKSAVEKRKITSKQAMHYQYEICKKKQAWHDKKKQGFPQIGCKKIWYPGSYELI